jgi:urease accessory protein
VRGLVQATVAGRRVVSLRTAPPISAKVLAGPTLLLVGSAAGLLEGDQIEIELSLEPGAQLVVRTVAATLAHACPGGGTTTFDVKVDAAQGASLAWLPQPLVAFAGCRHRSSARVRMQGDAAVVWAESLALGRHEEPSGDVEVRLDVELDGRPLLRDAVRAGPADKAAAGPAVLAGARHVGSVALLGRRYTLDDPAVMQLAGPGTLSRALAGDAASLERQLAPVRQAFIDRLTEELSHVA